MNRSKLDALWHEAEEQSRNEGVMYSRYHFAALVLANTPPQSFMTWQEGHEAGKMRAWPALMRGVRVEGDTVVISVKGGNDAARELCGALIEEMNR
jgi:hypothetical protein